MSILFPLMGFAESFSSDIKVTTQMCESSTLQPTYELKKCAEDKAYLELNSQCKATNTENYIETEPKYATKCYSARGSTGSQCFSSVFASCRFKF